MDRSCRHLQSHCIFRISCCVPVYRGKRCQRTYYSVIVIKTADPSICITGTPHSTVLKWLMFLVNVFIGIDRKHGPLQSPIIYQIVFNLSAGQAGLRLMPYSFGAALGSLGYGYLIGKTVRFFHLSLLRFPCIHDFVGPLLLAWNLDIRVSIPWNSRFDDVRF